MTSPIRRAIISSSRRRFSPCLVPLVYPVPDSPDAREWVVFGGDYTTQRYSSWLDPFTPSVVAASTGPDPYELQTDPDWGTRVLQFKPVDVELDGDARFYFRFRDRFDSAATLEYQLDGDDAKWIWTPGAGFPTEWSVPRGTVMTLRILSAGIYAYGPDGSRTVTLWSPSPNPRNLRIDAFLKSDSGTGEAHVVFDVLSRTKDVEYNPGIEPGDKDMCGNGLAFAESEPSTFGLEMTGAVQTVTTTEEIAYEDVSAESDPDFFGLEMTGEIQSVVMQEVLDEVEVSAESDPDFFGLQMTGDVTAITFTEHEEP